MPKKSLKGFVCVFALYMLTCSAAAAAGAIPINDLIENAARYDGREVTVEGEAIGEALERDGYAWVNINDGGNAIGIWMSSDDAGKLRYFGDYKNKGDIIRVTGVFSRDCPQHGGDIDIHCGRLEILSAGYYTGETISASKAAAACILAILAFFALAYYFIKLKRKRGGGK